MRNVIPRATITTELARVHRHTTQSISFCGLNFRAGKHSMKSDTDAQQHFPLDPSRRSFLGALLGLASAFIGALLAVPVLRYISYPLTANDSKDSDWTEIGSVASIGNVQTPLRRTHRIQAARRVARNSQSTGNLHHQDRWQAQGIVRYLSSPRLYCPLGSRPKRICMSMPWRQLLCRRHPSLRPAASLA